jgi:prepilin-type N-terminal cleavage/methylation domain-containing protein
MEMKNQRKKGFTLIELLVVITIIGILAGIAFVGFGDVFGSAGRTVAQKNLKTVYESLASKTRSFPMAEDVGSSEEFVVWWRNKTKDTRPELWFIGEDEEVKDLAEDTDGPGIPANIPDDAADFEADQVKALGYCVAIPGNDADTRSFVVMLRSGSFPIIWSRGLGAGDVEWSSDGLWAGAGGHVLFSDGTVRWYDDTKGKDGTGVFTKSSNKKDGNDKKAEPTSNIQDALPEGWKIYKPYRR